MVAVLESCALAKQGKKAGEPSSGRRRVTLLGFEQLCGRGPKPTTLHAAITTISNEISTLQQVRFCVRSELCSLKDGSETPSAHVQ